MTRVFKPYPAYRNSGSRWLGEVPNHWELRRLGQMGRLSKGNGGSKENETSTGISCVRYGDLYTTHSYFIEKSRSFISKEASKSYTPIFFGDILFAASGETIDEIGKSAVNLMRTEARCGGDVILFRSRNNVVVGYMGYMTNCYSSAAQKATMGRGITVMHLYGRHLKRLLLPIPPLAEQTAIVRYLDQVCEQIDSYISTKKRLIMVLNEKKQAIIHQAVMGGLDPNTPMKLTGIDWMPKVPVHWRIQRLKSRVTDVVDMTTRRRSNDIYIALEHVESWTGKIVNIDFLTKFESQAKRFRPDDVLFGKLRPYLAKTTRPDREGVCVGEFLVLRSRDDDIAPSYLEFWLRSKPVIDAIDASTFGAKMPRADWRFIGNMSFPLPPFSEQIAISAYLQKAIGKIDTTINRSRRQIDLLREYRDRLIDDVVTGKLDVREAHVDTGSESSVVEWAQEAPPNRISTAAPPSLESRLPRNDPT